MQNVKETAAIAGTATASPDGAIATTIVLCKILRLNVAIQAIWRAMENREKKWRIVNESRPNNEKMEEQVKNESVEQLAILLNIGEWDKYGETAEYRCSHRI